jgi:hypothetical protein
MSSSLKFPGQNFLLHQDPEPKLVRENWITLLFHMVCMYVCTPHANLYRAG